MSHEPLFFHEPRGTRGEPQTAACDWRGRQAQKFDERQNCAEKNAAGKLVKNLVRNVVIKRGRKYLGALLQKLMQESRKGDANCVLKDDK